jgi:hypothetical protein
MKVLQYVLKVEQSGACQAMTRGAVSASAVPLRAKNAATKRSDPTATRVLELRLNDLSQSTTVVFLSAGKKSVPLH